MRKTIRHSRWVDLKRSVIDEKKSNPKKGVYYFLERRLLDYKDAASRPDFKYKFWRNAPYEISTAMAEGWEFVTQKDPVFPDLAHLDAEGHWVFMDAVAMKLDLVTYLDYREDALERSQQAVKRHRESFAAHAAAVGAKAYTDKEVDALVAETKVQQDPRDKASKFVK